MLAAVSRRNTGSRIDVHKTALAFVSCGRCPMLRLSLIGERHMTSFAMDTGEGAYGKGDKNQTSRGPT
jgi:hypothetical protein